MVAVSADLSAGYFPSMVLETSDLSAGYFLSMVLGTSDSAAGVGRGFSKDLKLIPTILVFAVPFGAVGSSVQT